MAIPLWWSSDVLFFFFCIRLLLTSFSLVNFKKSSYPKKHHLLTSFFSYLVLVDKFNCSSIFLKLFLFRFFLSTHVYLWPRFGPGWPTPWFVSLFFRFCTLSFNFYLFCVSLSKWHSIRRLETILFRINQLSGYIVKKYFLNDFSEFFFLYHPSYALTWNIYQRREHLKWTQIGGDSC